MKIWDIFAGAGEVLLSLLLWLLIGVVALLGFAAFAFGKAGEWLFSLITIRPDEVRDPDRQDVFGQDGGE